MTWKQERKQQNCTERLERSETVRLRPTARENRDTHKKTQTHTHTHIDRLWQKETEREVDKQNDNTADGHTERYMYVVRE